MQKFRTPCAETFSLNRQNCMKNWNLTDFAEHLCWNRPLRLSPLFTYFHFGLVCNTCDMNFIIRRVHTYCSAPSNVCNRLHKCCELFLPYLVCPQSANTELGHCLTVEKETEEMEQEQHYWTLLKTPKTIGALIDKCMCEGIKRRPQININIFLSLITFGEKKHRHWMRTNLYSPHVSNACIRTCSQMEYTWKSCAFNSAHILTYA